MRHTERVQTVVGQGPTAIRHLDLRLRHGLELGPNHRQLIRQRARVFVDRLVRARAEAQTSGKSRYGAVHVVR